MCVCVRDAPDASSLCDVMQNIRQGPTTCAAAESENKGEREREAKT
jgi:hypothetical protein